MNYMERFGGCIVNDLSLNGKLTGFGWCRGCVEDAGRYRTYYREDTENGMSVELHFSGSFVGWHQEEVTVYDVRFYREDKEKACFLRDVPSRYFSEIVLQLDSATASGNEREENWRAERFK